MRARQAAALAVTISALTLGASACGGGSPAPKTTAAQERTAEAQWRTGLFEWRRTMLHALDGLSLIFSTDASVSELSRSGTRSSTGLTLYVHRLSRCATVVRLLGPVPQPFEQSRVYALEACKRLQQGVGKVSEVVDDLRHGRAVDPLDPIGDASNLLATGQTELSTAVEALDASSA
jgi:hypothetical protein